MKKTFFTLVLVLIVMQVYSQKKILNYGNLSLESGDYAGAVFNYDVIINNNRSLAQYKEASQKKALALYLNIAYVKAKKQWDAYVKQFGYDLPDKELYYYAHAVVQHGQYEMAKDVLSHVADVNNRETWTYNLVTWQLEQGDLIPEDIKVLPTNIGGFRKGIGMALKDELILLPRNNYTNSKSTDLNYGKYMVAIYKPQSPTEFEAATASVKDMNLGNTFYANPSVSGDYLLFGSSNTLSQAGRNIKSHMKKENTLQLYMTSLKGDTSGTTIHLGIGDEAYDYSFPFLHQDSLLFFATNQEGGQGGFDIMYTRASEEGWAEPRSLEGVNTTDHDIYPMVRNGKFYFSSKGHPGYGGTDMYEGDLIIEGDKVKVENIRNMGAPINTRNDDFGLVLKGDSTGYFMTNRFDMGIDHVVWLDKRYTLKDIIVELDLADSVGLLHMADSSLSFPDRSVYFGFDLAKLSAETKENLNDIIVIILRNPGLKVKLEGYTDAVGPTAYNLKLSERRNNAVRDYLLENNVSELDINTEAFGESRLIDDCDGDPESCSEGEHARNRQVKISLGSKLDTEITRSQADFVRDEQPVLENHFFFDFDADALTERAKRELDKIVAVMKENPGLSLKLEGHTDAYGTENHNLDLSEQRNLAVLAYLQAHNVSTSSVETEAFGKSMLVNNCSIPESCSEKENALNRFVMIKLFNNN